MDWVKLGTDVVVGGGVGALDQVMQNMDEKRRREKEAAGQEFGFFAQYGTYLNYLLPVLAVVNAAVGMVRGPWADKAILVGAQLAGRKATFQLTEAKQASPWRRLNPATPRPLIPLGAPARRTYEQEQRLTGARAF